MIDKDKSVPEKKYYYPNHFYTTYFILALTFFALLLVIPMLISDYSLKIKCVIVVIAIAYELLVIYAIKYSERNTRIILENNQLVFKQPLNPTRTCKLSEIKEVKIELYGGAAGFVLMIYLIDGSKFRIRGGFTKKDYEEIIQTINR